MAEPQQQITFFAWLEQYWYALLIIFAGIGMWFKTEAALGWKKALFKETDGSQVYIPESKFTKEVDAMKEDIEINKSHCDRITELESTIREIRSDCKFYLTEKAHDDRCKYNLLDLKNTITEAVNLNIDRKFAQFQAAFFNRLNNRDEHLSE